MKTFYGWIDIFWNDERISNFPLGLCLAEEIPQKKEINGNWDLLEEYYNKDYTRYLSVSRNKKVSAVSENGEK